MEPTQQLRIACARYVLGELTSDEMTLSADQALSSGVYSPALADLATMSYPNLADGAPMFERAMRELGLALPDREEAILLLVRDGLEQIVAGRIEPLAGLRALIRKVLDLPCLYDEDEHDVLQFVGLEDEYDYLAPMERRGQSVKAERDALDAEVRSAASQWLRLHGA